MASALVGLLLALAIQTESVTATVCGGAPETGASHRPAASVRDTTIDSLLERVETDDVRYVFVGERHNVGPVKRFAVDLVNALVAAGHDVGLYVEGFRAGCEEGEGRCSELGPDLAMLFNGEAFGRLRAESRAPVYGLDPHGSDRRVERMAETLAAAREEVRVVLVGNSHVVYAGDGEAEHFVYGGSVRFPNPGDLVEAMPHHETVVVALEPAVGEGAPRPLPAEPECAKPYALVEGGGSRSDYRLIVPYRSAY